MKKDRRSRAPLPTAELDRRRFLTLLSGAAGAAALSAGAEETPDAEKISKEAVARAEELAGLSFTDAERELMLEGLAEQRQAYRAIREVALPNEVAPAFRFDPLPPGEAPPTGAAAYEPARGKRPRRPLADADLAFLPATDLGELLRAGEVSSVELTQLYLTRLERYDPLLECVVTLTRERALEQAERADRELAAGRDRGPLHGIPWGAKDLLAVAGYPTTWGATTHKDQVLDENATVVERLERAGAVLVAKLTLGALAWGDVWFGGKTRNPWLPSEGSSGSSAGSAAAAAAGLAGFTLGSETWGSIISPSTRCGATGLRPTFGRVSRHGAMALSWTMDKLGPICRSVEDCAAVFAAIYGPDGRDRTVVDAPFRWQPDRDVRRLRVGYVRALFEAEPEEGLEQSHAFDLATLETLESLGIELIPMSLPELPVDALSFLLAAEAAAAFDELTRSNRDDLLKRQIKDAWPNVFRQARMIPAVEYVQANRVRMLLIEEMARRMADLDVYVAPSFGGDNLLLTNLSGHPAVVLPNGFEEDGTPTSITFTGRLYDEGNLLALAKSYQDATDFHLVHPDLDAGWEVKKEAEEKEGQDVAALARSFRRALAARA